MSETLVKTVLQATRYAFAPGYGPDAKRREIRLATGGPGRSRRPRRRGVDRAGDRRGDGATRWPVQGGRARSGGRQPRPLGRCRFHHLAAAPRRHRPRAAHAARGGPRARRGRGRAVRRADVEPVRRRVVHRPRRAGGADLLGRLLGVGLAGGGRDGNDDARGERRGGGGHGADARGDLSHPAGRGGAARGQPGRSVCSPTPGRRVADGPVAPRQPRHFAARPPPGSRRFRCGPGRERRCRRRIAHRHPRRPYAGRASARGGSRRPRDARRPLRRRDQSSIRGQRSPSAPARGGRGEHRLHREQCQGRFQSPPGKIGRLHGRSSPASRPVRRRPRALDRGP